MIDLQDLQQWLQREHQTAGSSSIYTISTVSDLEVARLQHAAQALQELGRHLALQQPSQPSTSQAVTPTATATGTAASEAAGDAANWDPAAAAGCAELLVQMLLQPPEPLFAGLGGAPSDPSADMLLAGACRILLCAVLTIHMSCSSLEATAIAYTRATHEWLQAQSAHAQQPAPHPKHAQQSIASISCRDAT